VLLFFLHRQQEYSVLTSAIVLDIGDPIAIPFLKGFSQFETRHKLYAMSQYRKLAIELQD